MPRRAAAWVGVGAAGLSAALAAVVAVRFCVAPPPGHVFRQTLWTWFDVGGFAPAIGLRLDPLALVMVLAVTFIGFLIHVYSADFMAQAGDPPGEGYSRFFAWMNLFVAAMLVLVLADNLLLLYLGWEGVGLCSYLLIGFWYRSPANGYAARKAFVMTRVGDAALAVALLLLFAAFGTLNVDELVRGAPVRWALNTPLAVAVAALLLAGAVGKSAQLPLQTWLPDAMAGPSPVSALIHAATMVTAGVYLIARLHVLFERAPVVLTAVAVIGAVTLLLAGCSALVQRDLKRVLAYSTMSQIGYMFLALGVSAWPAAINHLVTHALFKSLLFLAAGVVIIRLREEHDMFRMGGLRRSLPLVFWSFLAASLALTALPPATAGLSKEGILAAAWAAPGGRWFYAAGLTGVFITALYTFRMLFLTFCGAQHTPPDERRLSWRVQLPFVLLAAGCLAGGALQWPAAWGGRERLLRFLGGTFGAAPSVAGGRGEAVLAVGSLGAALAGLVLAWLLYQRRPALLRLRRRMPGCDRLRRFWLAGWGFDSLYDLLLVRPFVAFARANRTDSIDTFYNGLARLAAAAHREMKLTQSGLVRAYAAALIAGAAFLIWIVVLL